MKKEIIIRLLEAADDPEKELKPTSGCFKDYINSQKKTGNCEPATVNGYLL
jgi:hypothetical protein